MKKDLRKPLLTTNPRFLDGGQKKISQQLKLKGISQRNIQDALKTIDRVDTIASILHLIKKKEPQYKGLQLYQKKIKLTRYLLSKGYEFDLINQQLEEYYN
jgi:regulatory protein